MPRLCSCFWSASAIAVRTCREMSCQDRLYRPAHARRWHGSFGAARAALAHLRAAPGARRHMAPDHAALFCRETVITVHTPPAILRASRSPCWCSATRLLLRPCTSTKTFQGVVKVHFGRVLRTTGDLRDLTKAKLLKDPQNSRDATAASGAAVRWLRAARALILCSRHTIHANRIYRHIVTRVFRRFFPCMISDVVQRQVRGDAIEPGPKQRRSACAAARFPGRPSLRTPAGQCLLWPRRHPSHNDARGRRSVADIDARARRRPADRLPWKRSTRRSSSSRVTKVTNRPEGAGQASHLIRPALVSGFKRLYGRSPNYGRGQGKCSIQPGLILSLRRGPQAKHLN